MKPRLVEYLECPDCAGDIALDSGRTESIAAGGDGEIMDGELRCKSCKRMFPIRHGVPRLVPAGTDHRSVEVAASFGWEWNHFDEMRPHYHQQFLDWIQPLTAADFHDKLVLDGGCGKGRHAALAAGYGAREVFAIDLGSAVEAAFRNTRHLRAVNVIQGDITRPPIKRCADLAYSVGVLHHLPDPESGFRALLGKVKPGGKIAVWVYGFEGNEWIVKFVDPVRSRVTSRLPRGLLYEAARLPAWLVAGASKGVYAPLGKVAPSLNVKLFYNKYLTYIAQFPVREIHSIVFDQLVTPVTHHLTHDEVAGWFSDARLENVLVARHNDNSWRGSGRLRMAQAAAATSTSADAPPATGRP